MKIEMDSESVFAISVVSISIVVICLMIAIYNYEVSFIKEGYTQKLIPSTQCTYWAKDSK